MNKKFQDLNLSNAFLFAAAMEDEETCRFVLETVLGIPVGKVNVHTEHSLLYNADFRSIRLDVYAGSETYVEYNCEMENRNDRNLAKRSRFHQAEMDVTLLQPGEDFSQLRPVYVIFICTFDPFGRGLFRYTFENRCQETGLPLEDGAVRVFLNTKGTSKGEVPVPDTLVNFLKYVEDSSDTYVREVDDPAVKDLHERIRKLKASRKLEVRYMKFEELLRESKEEGYETGRSEGYETGRNDGYETGRSVGYETGRTEGQARLLRLISLMTEAGEADQIARLEREPEFLEQMLTKHDL